MLYLSEMFNFPTMFAFYQTDIGTLLHIAVNSYSVGQTATIRRNVIVPKTSPHQPCSVHDTNKKHEQRSKAPQKTLKYQNQVLNHERGLPLFHVAANE